MGEATIPARLFAHGRTRGDSPAYYVKDPSSQQWRMTNYRDYAALVKKAARAMIAGGFAEDGKVCILGFNRPEWCIFALAAMAAGGAASGIYLTSSAPEIQYILDHSEASFLLIETKEHWEKIKSLPRKCRVVAMPGAGIDDPEVIGWDAFLASGEGVPERAVEERTAALRPDGVAVLIYTSGTTGPPKAVMLSHNNITWVSDSAQKLGDTSGDDQLLSYLPLAHIAEQVFTIHGAASIGYAVWFVESLLKLPDNLKEVRPTFFFGVPRIWEKFHAGISAKLASAPPSKKMIFEWATGVGRRANERKNRGETPGGLLAVQYRIANKLVFSKLRQALGLDRTRVCVSGAAPIAPHVLEFFAGLDLTVHEVYGQSEDAGPTTFNYMGRVKYGTVGQPLDGLEVKIASDGEILVRGPSVFLGYYKDPAATAETLIDGWLHSGDLGEQDKDGFVRITGRKKEIIITAGGKNIAPRNIEEAIKKESLVEEVVVIGDRRRYLTALVTVNMEAMAKFAPGLSQAQAAQDPRVEAAIAKQIELVNKDLASVETVKKFRILPRSFTIESGELTPSLKIKRKKVAEQFAAEIESMYPPEGVMAL